jgi:hypothetical protein
MLQDSACRADRRRGVGVLMVVDADDNVKISIEPACSSLLDLEDINPGPSDVAARP